MAIVSLDKDGNRVVRKRGQTLVEKVKNIKAEQAANGEKVSPCIKDIVETKQKLKDEGVL